MPREFGKLWALFILKTMSCSHSLITAPKAEGRIPTPGNHTCQPVHFLESGYIQ